MPLYEYECDRCKRRVEELRAMKDRATLYACAACDNAGDCGLLYPLLSVPGFRRDHTMLPSALGVSRADREHAARKLKELGA
jgi:putative FmdB family regulatory protein